MCVCVWCVLQQSRLESISHDLAAINSVTPPTVTARPGPVGPQVGYAVHLSVTDLMLIQQNKFYWISNTSDVADLTCTIRPTQVSLIIGRYMRNLCKLRLTVICLHGTAPSYLANIEFIRSLDLDVRGRLRSASSSSLIVRRTRLLSVATGLFRSLLLLPVSGTNYHHVTSRHVTSLLNRPLGQIFCSRLKTHLFSCYFPDFL